MCLQHVEEHSSSADKRLDVSDVLPLVKVSRKQGFELVNELRFSANPFDKWFRFHCVKFQIRRKGTKYFLYVQKKDKNSP